MWLDWAGSTQGNIFVVRLFIMGTSGGGHVIVGRDCNERVNICTVGMGEIADKYTENETNTTQDQ
jgi:hypothetical protein